MRLEQLWYLLYVADCGSINSAGKKYYISPQAIHAALNKLENSVGVVLFERSGRGIEFTNAGLIMLEFAKHVFFEYNQAMQAIKAINIEEKSTFENLVIYAPRLFENYLDPALMDFLDKFPHVLVSTFFEGSRSIEKKIELNTNDNVAGIIALDKETYEQRKETIDHVLLGYGRLYYCARKDSFLTKIKRIDSGQIISAPIIIFRSTDVNLDIATISSLNKYMKPKIQGYAASFKIFANFILRYDCVGVYADFSKAEQRLINIKDYAGLQLLDYMSEDDRVFIYRTSAGCSETAKAAMERLFENLRARYVV